MKRTFVLVIVLLVVVTGFVPAQSGGEPTIEELYLSQDLQVQIIRSQALSNDRDMKLLALQSIRDMGNEGSPEVMAILTSLVGEGTMRQVRSNGAVINYYPEVRRSAAEILGDIGGERSKDILLDVVMEDPEPMVLAEAIYALGKIGINEDNEVTDRLVYVLRRENARVTPDNNLAYATLLGLEKLAQAGSRLDAEAVNLILEVATGGYISTVRLKALDVLRTLRGQ